VTVLAPLIVVALVVGAALWVLADARQWDRQGTPVGFRAGPIAIDTPQAWAIACLVLFVIFLPIYAVARRS
jgi:hypothetical protein